MPVGVEFSSVGCGQISGPYPDRNAASSSRCLGMERPLLAESGRSVFEVTRLEKCEKLGGFEMHRYVFLLLTLVLASPLKAQDRPDFALGWPGGM